MEDEVKGLYYFLFGWSLNEMFFIRINNQTVTNGTQWKFVLRQNVQHNQQTANMFLTKMSNIWVYYVEFWEQKTEATMWIEKKVNI